MEGEGKGRGQCTLLSLLSTEVQHVGPVFLVGPIDHLLVQTSILIISIQWVEKQKKKVGK